MTRETCQRNRAHPATHGQPTRQGNTKTPATDTTESADTTMMTSSSWLRLAGRTAIVTGAGSGIGSAVAKCLAFEGVNVLLADANGKAAERVANDIIMVQDGSNSVSSGGSNIGRVQPLICDVTNVDQVQKMIADADTLAAASSSSSSSSTPENSSRKNKPILPPIASILVNCAGITRDGLVPNMSIDDFDSVIDVNLKGTWLACKYFCAEDRLAALQKHYQELVAEEDNNYSSEQSSGIGTTTTTVRASDGGASIINIGSVVSRTGNVGQTNYGASKGGVVGLTRSLAKEMARHGVRANAILPGFIDTPMAQAVPQRIRDGIQRKIPLGSFGRPQDIANLACFLASSERSGYITGETVECSGMIAL